MIWAKPRASREAPRLEPRQCLVAAKVLRRVLRLHTAPYWIRTCSAVEGSENLKEDFSELVFGYTTSGAEQVAEWAESASVFKAFYQTGFNIMSSPVFAGQLEAIDAGSLLANAL